MSRYVKQLLVEEMRCTFGQVRDLVVLDINRLNANENNQLRLALKDKDIRIRVVKNRLAKRGFSELGLGSIGELFQGPSAIAWGGPSIVELAKEIKAWADKLPNVQVKGGATDGVPLTPKQLEALSKLPPREVLIARIASLALAPAARLVALMNWPAARVAAQVKELHEGDKRQGAAASGKAAGVS